MTAPPAPRTPTARRAPRHRRAAQAIARPSRAIRPAIVRGAGRT